MTQDLKTGLFLLLIIAGVVFAGCTGNSGTIMTPVSPSVTATPGTGSDLTNQDSPLAATFRNGASFTPLAPQQTPIGLERFAGGFSSPMMIALPHDGTGRMAVADQIGVVKMIGPDRKVSDKPFLDVRDRMVKLNSNYDERGLFSIAFHPDYRNNGRVFVYYSAPLQPGAPAGWSATNRLSEFHVMAGNPDAVDMSSEKILLDR